MTESGYQVIKGRKFDKVVRVVGDQRDVKAFIEQGTGTVYSAASWTKPSHRMTNDDAARWTQIAQAAR